MTPRLGPDDVAGPLAELVRVPSVNPAIAADEAHGEAAVAACARDWLKERGVEAWLEEARPGRPNTVARVRGGAGATLIVCAHLDTVGTAGMTIAPFEPRREGERMFGRGSYDMKGGAAAAMVAAVELARGGFDGELLLALVADEEHASFGAEDFVARHRGDGCILTEPSEGQLILAHKGFVWAEVVTTGRAAHGSRWDLGVSAISRMGRVLVALEAFDRDVLRTRVHPLVGPASMHPGLVSGGVGLSTYAPECRLKVECRTLPGERNGDVVAELRRLVRAADETAEVTSLLEREPLTCDRDAPIARATREAVTAATGAAPPEVGVGFWMDAAIFSAAGIPTVDYGPTGAGAHEAVEWVDLRSVATTANVLVDAARRFCARA